MILRRFTFSTVNLSSVEGSSTAAELEINGEVMLWTRVERFTFSTFNLSSAAVELEINGGVMLRSRVDVRFGVTLRWEVNARRFFLVEDQTDRIIETVCEGR